MLAHLREMVAATDLPLNADFENGHALDAAGLAASVRLAVGTGIAGLSIEDATGNTAAPLFDLDTAVERMRAARRAIDRSGGDVLLVGRADCLYAPGIAKPEQIAAIVAAVAPKPINLLSGPASKLTLAEIAKAGSASGTVAPKRCSAMPRRRPWARAWT